LQLIKRPTRATLTGSPNLDTSILSFWIGKKVFSPLFFHSTASDLHYDDSQLIDAIREKKIDVIVSVELFSFISRQASALCERFSLSHVVIVWENISGHPFYHLPPFRGNVNSVLRRISKIVAVTNRSKVSLLALNIPAEKVAVIYPGVFLDRFRPLKMEKEFSMLFVGGLEKHKGFHLLLQVFENLSERYDGLTLGVVGDGRMKGRLLDVRRKCGEQRIVYFGNVPHSEVCSIYPRAKIFCFPSLRQKMLNLLPIREEQFGFCLVEAMASGLPVVATNMNVMREIVDNGCLFAENDLTGFQNIISTLVENEDLRKRASAQNRVRAQKLFDARKQSKLLRKCLVSG